MSDNIAKIQIQIERYKQHCEDCDFINPWTGIHECGQCPTGRRLKKLRNDLQLEKEVPQYTTLFAKIIDMSKLSSKQQANLVNTTRKYYRIGGGRETPLSALQRIEEALESEKWIE